MNSEQSLSSAPGSPESIRELSKLFSAYDLAAQREACEASLYRFVIDGWHVLEPGQEFIDGRHIRLICAELEKVSRGKTQDLLINVPPGHMKSLLVMVFWPAWEWTWNPHRRFLCASYSDDLSERDSSKMRRLIQSEWYQARWGHRFGFMRDQNEKDGYENTETGARIIANIGGEGTGKGGNHLLLDDPHNAVTIHHGNARSKVQNWWREVWASRMRPPGSGGRVVIMQRLHTDDLSGFLLKQKGWKHICLPFEYERDHPHRSRQDWRTKNGEILWPEMFDRAKAEKFKDNLSDEEGDYAVAGQLQQRPSPRGGGILKIAWWRIWGDEDDSDVVPAALAKARGFPPKTDFRLLSIDTAYTEKEHNDCSAATLWGRFRDEQAQPNAIMMYAWCDRLEMPELVEHLHRLIKRFKPNAILVENKANGISVMQELRRRVKEKRIIGFDPKRYGDKIARAYASQVMFKAGVVWTLDRSWASQVIEDCGAFPAIKIKDRVDTVTQALIWMRRNGYLMPKDETDVRYLEKMRPKPPLEPLYTAS